MVNLQEEIASNGPKDHISTTVSPLVYSPVMSSCKAPETTLADTVDETLL